MDAISPPPPPLSDAEDARTIGRRSTHGATVEVILRGEPRRRWTPEQKRDIVAESLGPELTLTEVARKYRISSGLLYTWRQQIRSQPGGLLTRSQPRFAQVRITAAPSQPAVPKPLSPFTPPLRLEGLIEIVLPDGVSLRVDAQVNAKALRRVLDALRDQ